MRGVLRGVGLIRTGIVGAPAPEAQPYQTNPVIPVQYTPPPPPANNNNTYPAAGELACSVGLAQCIAKGSEIGEDPDGVRIACTDAYNNCLSMIWRGPTSGQAPQLPFPYGGVVIFRNPDSPYFRPYAPEGWR
jgi:hypothetical protein